MAFLDKWQQDQTGQNAAGYATPASPNAVAGTTPQPTLRVGGFASKWQSTAQPQSQTISPDQRATNLATIAGGVNTAQRNVPGQEVAASPDQNWFTRNIVRPVGNFILGSAPDIIARDIASNDPEIQQIRQTIINNAQNSIKTYGDLITKARERGDEQRAQRLEGVLAQDIDTANQSLGEGVFNTPSILQNIGAAATIGLAVAAPELAPDALLGEKIGVKTGINALGQTVETGIRRAPQTLLQRAGQFGIGGAAFGGATELARSGDVGSALKTGAETGLLTAALPVLGRGASALLEPLASRLENPLSAKTAIGRDIFAALSPVSNVIKSVGESGAKLLQKLNDIKVTREGIKAEANKGLEEFKKVYDKLSPAQQDEYYMITHQNTAENAALQGRGQYTVEELKAQTSDPLIKEAIGAAEHATVPVSESLAGLKYVRDIKNPEEAYAQAINRTPEAKPIIEYAKGKTDTEVVAKLNEVESKAKTIGYNGLDSTEQKLYDSYQDVLRGKKTLEEVLKDTHATRIERMAGKPTVFFPSQLEEPNVGTGITQQEIADTIAKSETLSKTAQTDPELAQALARKQLETNAGRGTGPFPGKARSRIFGSAEEARANGINTNAVEAYQNFVERQSSIGAQLQTFGNEEVNKTAGALGTGSADEIARAQKTKLLDAVKQDLDKKFSPKEAEAWKNLIDKQTDVFLYGGDFGSVVQTLKEFNAFKLSTSFIKNTFQVFSNLLEADLPSFFKGVRSIFSESGREFARKSGALQQEILETKSTSTIQKVLDKILKPLTFVENNINRVASANTGMHYADYLAKLANSTEAGAPDALARLEELLNTKFKPGQAIELSEKDLLKAANRFTSATQFGYNPLEIPYWANTKLGSLAFQFKNFAYRQLVFVLDNTINEFRNGNPGRATANMLAIGTIFPISGEVAGAIQNFISGKQTQHDLLTIHGYIDRVSTSGGLGYATDVIGTAGKQGGKGVLLNLLGPTATSATQAFDAAMASGGHLLHGEVGASLEDLFKFGTQQAGGVGSGVRNITGIQ